MEKYIINHDVPVEERKRISLEIDPTLLPETLEFFESHMNEDISAYDFATALVECDKTVDMPRVLFDFVVNLYKTAIDMGNTDAMNDLGALYYNGRGGEPDYTKAVYYYDMAAKLGNRQAQENLGYCYYYGRNIPVDYEKAFHYFALGAFDGHLISLYKIGDMYMNGYYVEKNPTIAFHIYERCLETMTDKAAPIVAGPLFLRLGNAFLLGNGTEENPTNALVCFQKAELYLYDMVMRGEWMYQSSLQNAINGQERARAILNDLLPR